MANEQAFNFRLFGQRSCLQSRTVVCIGGAVNHFVQESGFVVKQIYPFNVRQNIFFVLGIGAIGVTAAAFRIGGYVFVVNQGFAVFVLNIFAEFKANQLRRG